MDNLNGRDRLDDVLVELTIGLTLKWLFRHGEADHSSLFLLAKQHIDLPLLVIYACITIFFILSSLPTVVATVNIIIVTAVWK